MDLTVKVIGEGIDKPKKVDDVGYDLKSSEQVILEPRSFRRIAVDARLSMPEGVYAIIRGRSGWASKGILAHHGTIDTGYQGPVDVILHNMSDEAYVIEKGDRIGQLVFFPTICPELEQVEEFDIVTERGDTGFGSTGTANG